VPLAYLALVLVPVCILSAIFLIDPEPLRAVGIGALALTLFGIVWYCANDPPTVLALPLAWFDVPTPPLTAEEQREGWGSLWVLVFLAVAPYVLMTCVIVRWPFS
jgi:hypothetical protein